MTAKNWGKHEGVVILLRRADGMIYMAKRLAKDRPFEGRYSPPGGSIEDGETREVAAVRELKEETGLVIAPERLWALARRGPFITLPAQMGSGTPYYMIYFGMDLLSKEIPQALEPHKQGPWEAKTHGDWILQHELCPGIDEMLELLKEASTSKNYLKRIPKEESDGSS